MHRAEQLTRAFYEWELRGRSWERFDYPVALAPPVSEPKRPRPLRIDDGRRETWLSSLFASPQPEPEPEVEEDLAPEPIAPPPEYKSHQILLPESADVTVRAAEGWLRSIKLATHPVAWELVSDRRGVAAEVAPAREDEPPIVGSLESLFPEASIQPASESIGGRWAEADPDWLVGVEWGLGHEFMVPLSLLTDYRVDPLAQIVGALSGVGSDGVAIFQILAEPVDSRWPEAIRRAVTTPSGQPFFADAPEITKLAFEKVSAPLLAVGLRLVVGAPSRDAAWDVARGVGAGLEQLTSPGNELIPVSTEDPERVLSDVLRRTTHRHGMLLSTRELAGLVHPPGRAVTHPALRRVSLATSPAPQVVQEVGVVLGVNEHQGHETEVRLPIDARMRHTHVVGASGTGKSTLLVSMLLDDIAQGHGVGVLDPHGDLVDELLARIPESRHSDVVLIDPADPDYVVGWNLLGAATELERELLASDLAATFQRLATSWGDQMTTVLSNAVLELLNSPRATTLMDLRAFLVDERFRNEFLPSVTDPYIRSYWQEDFQLIAKRGPQGPILTRLNMFLRNRLVREVVTATEGHVDLRKVMDEQKILLVRLSQGAIGEENAALLGSLLVSKIHQVTLSRQELSQAERSPFFLVLDEFHEQATPSMATMFSGVRKYGLALTVAHQDLYQLRHALPEVERAVMANSHSRICFRVGDEDAKRLSDGFASFEASDLTNLGIGEALARVGKAADDFNLRTFKLEDLAEKEAAERRRALREKAMIAWGVPRTEEETEAPAPEEAVAERQPSPAATTDTPEELGALQRSIDKQTLDYLESVAREPFLAVRKRNEALSLAASTGQKIKQTLLEDRLVREVAINPGDRGSQFKLLELTSAGRGILKKFDVPLPRGHGRGGIAHQWWVDRIARYLEEEGFKPAIEDETKGVRVDLVYRRGNKLIAVEIETSRGHIRENIEKDLDAGFKEVVSLLDESLPIEEIEAKLRSELKDQMRSVRLGSLPEFKKRLASPHSARRLARGNENKEPRRSRRRRGRSQAPLEPEPRSFGPGALSTPAAAEYLGISPATLQTKRSRGGGPVFSKLGKRVVYRREDLDDWVQQLQKRSTSE